MAPLWRNWAGNQACHPQRVLTPASEEELVDIVRRAGEAGVRLKVVGSGGSFSGIALTDGWLVSLERYREVVRVDKEARTVTVQAGIRLWDLCVALDRLGLALENVGDVAIQTVAGAMATGTHGTGLRYGCLPTQVVGLRLIAADGRVVDCSPEEDGELFRCARVGLGALGVVSTVTLRVVPAFNLHVQEEMMPLQRVLAEMQDMAQAHDHYEFFWFPHTEQALVRINEETQEPLRARPPWKEFWEDIVTANLAFGAMCYLGRWRPSLIPTLVGRFLPSRWRTEYVDKSYKGFTSPRLVRFVEMEYAIPREAAAEALSRVKALIEREGLYISFPVQVRFVAPDDIPLSMAYGRETCFIAVHVFRGMPYERYFRGVEAIMRDYVGRPHWGKLHFQDASTLAPLYPEWELFQQVRARLDPRGMFLNPYLERVLGVAP